MLFKNLAFNLDTGLIPLFSEQGEVYPVEAVPLYSVRENILEKIEKKQRELIAYKHCQAIWQTLSCAKTKSPFSFFNSVDSLAYIFTSIDNKEQIKVYGINAFDYCTDTETIYISMNYRKPFFSAKDKVYKGIGLATIAQAANLYLKKFPEANNYDIALWLRSTPEAVENYKKYGFQYYGQDQSLGYVNIPKNLLKKAVGLKQAVLDKILKDYYILVEGDDNDYRLSKIYKDIAALSRSIEQLNKMDLLTKSQVEKFIELIKQRYVALMYMYAGQTRGFLNNYREKLISLN